MTTYTTKNGEQSRNGFLAGMSGEGWILWGSAAPKTEGEIIAIYVARYPHLRLLAASGRRRDLGNNMARLAYPEGISGRDALLISKIGLE